VEENSFLHALVIPSWRDRERELDNFGVIVSVFLPLIDRENK
jgi:hypothetical protein